MLTCREASSLLSAARDHDLNLASRMSLRVHLLLCGGCRNFGRQLQLIHHIAADFAGGANETPPPGSTEESGR